MHVCVHLLPFQAFSSPSALHSSSFCLTNPAHYNTQRWRCSSSIGPCTCCCHSNWILTSACPPTHYPRDRAVMKLGELRKLKDGCKESRWMFYWSESVGRAAGLRSCHVVLIVLVIVALGTGNGWRSGFTDLCFSLSLSLSLAEMQTSCLGSRDQMKWLTFIALVKTSLDRVSLQVHWRCITAAAHRYPQLLYDCLMLDVYPKICTSALIGWIFQESGSKIALCRCAVL